MVSSYVHSKDLNQLCSLGAPSSKSWTLRVYTDHFKVYKCVHIARTKVAIIYVLQILGAMYIITSDPYYGF